MITPSDIPENLLSDREMLMRCAHALEEFNTHVTYLVMGNPGLANDMDYRKAHMEHTSSTKNQGEILEEIIRESVTIAEFNITHLHANVAHSLLVDFIPEYGRTDKALSVFEELKADQFVRLCRGQLKAAYTS